jgi:hypothetical protein
MPHPLSAGRHRLSRRHVGRVGEAERDGADQEGGDRLRRAAQILQAALPKHLEVPTRVPDVREEQPAARPEHARDLAHRRVPLRRVINVVQRLFRDDHVEGAVVEREPAGVAVFAPMPCSRWDARSQSLPLGELRLLRDASEAEQPVAAVGLLVGAAWEVMSVAPIFGRWNRYKVPFQMRLVSAE